MSEAPKLSSYEATARGVVTTCQNSGHPICDVLTNVAASGTSTIAER